MPLLCEDLADYGIVLVPPSAPDYDELYFDVLHRLLTRPDGAPQTDPETIAAISERRETGSAILVNRASQAVISFAYIWSFPEADGRLSMHSSSPGTDTSVLLPFGSRPEVRKSEDYWKTIFTGSKRLIVAACGVFGDNTDVRPPTADELRHHQFSFGRNPKRTDAEPPKLTLDGVFFTDGGFAGPNQLGSWEATTAAAQTYLDCGTLARRAHPEFFEEVAKLTGYDHTHPPPPPPPPLSLGARVNSEFISQRERRLIGWRISRMREMMGDEDARAAVEAWLHAPVPQFHKL